MAPVDVLIPWAGHDPDRRLALTAVQDGLRASFPRWNRVLCRDYGPGWSKGRALTVARRFVETSEARVVVVHDADVVLAAHELERAVNLVATGSYGWAIPHTRLVRLTQDGTRRRLAGLELDELLDVEEDYTGVMGGGIVVVDAELYRRCPLDPRFAGWGEEDHAWGVALQALGGRAWRGTGTLVHLWHPPQERPDRKRGSTASRALRRRYVLARRDPAAMRALIDEATS